MSTGVIISSYSSFYYIRLVPDQYVSTGVIISSYSSFYYIMHVPESYVY